MKHCCIIGHRKIVINEKLINSLKFTILSLIKENNVTCFFFGSKSQFNDLCYDIIAEIKKTHKRIKRVYVRAEYPHISKEYENYLSSFYEETFYYNKELSSCHLNYIKRNEVMINKSDYCLFFCDLNYTPAKKTKSGTILAYEYALKKNKNIINIFN